MRSFWGIEIKSSSQFMESERFEKS
uniref:Uncharacterized protein n=1 Tax=Rhizophora mucronata TaxID=61149 RepID=A0A2P2QEU6_RHIMU